MGFDCHFRGSLARRPARHGPDESSLAGADDISLALLAIFDALRLAMSDDATARRERLPAHFVTAMLDEGSPAAMLLFAGRPRATHDFYAAACQPSYRQLIAARRLLAAALLGRGGYAYILTVYC